MLENNYEFYQKTIFVFSLRPLTMHIFKQDKQKTKFEPNWLLDKCRFCEQCKRECMEYTYKNSVGCVVSGERHIDAIMPCCTLFPRSHAFTATYIFHLENLIARFGLNAVENCDFFGATGLSVARRWIADYNPRSSEELDKITNKAKEYYVAKK